MAARKETETADDVQKVEIVQPQTKPADPNAEPVVTNAQEARAAAAEKGDETAKTAMERAGEAGIGLVTVDGNGFKYVGIAPARDGNAATDAGMPVSAANSTFTPLSDISPVRGMRVKDPDSGEFYFISDDMTSGWDAVNLNGSPLIPAAAKSSAKK